MASPASNKAFRNSRNVRSMAGSIKYTWNPIPSERRKKPTRGPVVCDNATPIDNVVTYVYDIDPITGDHIAYVDCDYVD